jgi:uncharacterized membrane protein
VPTLIAIGYPDETTAAAAADEARAMARDLGIEREAIAVISRNRGGGYQVDTNHRPGPAGATWGLFWGLLFGVLFFVSVLDTAVGAGLGALLTKVAKSGIDREFQVQVRDLLQPGTSALFLLVDGTAPDRVVEPLQRYGGTVLKSPISKDQERALQAALQGEQPLASVS